MEQLQTMSGGTGMAEEAKKALENIRKKKAKVDQMHKNKIFKGENGAHVHFKTLISKFVLWSV